QREAGSLLHVSKDVVSNWERGKSYPSIKKIPEIERLYSVRYDDLIFLPNNTA
ncbi:MAG TPA: XRE family transcriptional regulator, partial [Ruminococcaceae bacterium]|nr:XRE family transcriptional regulator [Oscillospiraceae bacterium]